MGGAQLGCHERGFWGAWGSSALPKGAQLHHVLLLESLRGFGPKAEQLGCSWLCREREGVKSRCCQHPPSPHVLSSFPVPTAVVRLELTLTMLMGFRERW